MYLAPTDFIAKNVSVMVKYMADDKPRWCHGYITEVIEYGFQDNHYYVDANVKYDDEYDVVTETFWDYDYETDTEDAWKFTNDYAPLVQNVLNTLEERIIEEQLEEDIPEESICETDCDDDNDSETQQQYPEDDDNYEDDFENDSEDDVSDEYDNEEDLVVIRRKPSLLNRFFATMFVCSPLIATCAVLYNARFDIGNYVCKTYC